jgi:hypothetical protein
MSQNLVWVNRANGRRIRGFPDAVAFSAALLGFRPTMLHTVPRAVLFTALACALGCSSPGEPYRYHDVKVYPALSAPTTTPTTQTDVTLSFGIFNTDIGAGETATYTVTRADVHGNTTTVQAATAVALPADGWATISVDLGMPVAAYNSGTDTGSGAFTYTVTIDPVAGEQDSSNNTGSLIVTWADLNLSFTSTPTVTAPDTVSATPATITAAVTCADVTSGAITATARAVAFGVTLLDGTDITSQCTITATTPAGTYPVDIAAGATQTYTVTLPASVVAGTSVILTIDPGANVPESLRSDNTVTLVIPSTT